MMRAVTLSSVASLACALTLWTSPLTAQVVPAIERQAGPCTQCAPDGWRTTTPNPNVIVGDGAWPGGESIVSDVLGGPVAGSNMAILLHQNASLEEALSTTVSGLLPNQEYRYKVFTQACRLTGSVTYTAAGTIARAMVNGTSKAYTGSAGDAWTPLEVTFAASATGTADIELRVLGNSLAGDGTCAVFDAAAYTILPARFVNIDEPAAGSLVNDSTPSIRGQALGAQSVSITIREAQGAAVQTVVAHVDAQGDWSFDASMLPDGAYSVEAIIDDGFGNTLSSGRVNFALDTTPPALTLTQPVDGVLTNDNTPTISGTTVPGLVVRVIFFDPLFMAILYDLSATADAQGDWSVDAPVLVDGAYWIGVSTEDSAGNQSAGQVASLKIDTSPPALSLSSPTANQIVPDSALMIVGTCEPRAQLRVELFDVNGQSVGVELVSATPQGQWSASFMGVSDGNYTAQISAQDAAGNSAAAQVSFEVDAQAPMVQIDGPQDQAVSNEPSPTISGVATADSVVVVVITDAQSAEVASLMAVVDPITGAWSVTPDQPLTDGDYSIEASATRRNAKMANASIDWTLDTQAPATTITLPAQEMISNNNQPTITGNSEPGATLEITLTDAQGTIIETLSASADVQGAWSADSTMTLADGSYTINVTAADAAMNTAMATPVTWSIDATAPLVMISSPAQGTTTRETTITLEGSAEPSASVEIFVDGAKVDEVIADAQGAWRVTLAALSIGEHTFEATSSDEAGNNGSSGQIKVIIEATPELPPAPVVIISPAPGTTVTESSLLVAGTGEPGAKVIVTVNEIEQAVTVAEDGTWSVSVTFNADGDQTITATDGEQQTTVTISVVLPVAPAEPEDREEPVVDDGCGCASTSTGPRMPAAALLWLVGLVGLTLRRRRKRALISR